MFQGKIFCIGIIGTGSAATLRRLGALGSASLATPARLGSRLDPVLKPLLEADDCEPALTLAAEFRGFEGEPWNVGRMPLLLDARFPGSRFILTSRTPESWWRVVTRRLSADPEETSRRLMTQLGITTVDRAAMIAAYRARNAEIEAHFADTGRLLMLDADRKRDWERVYAFLDISVPAAEPAGGNRRASAERRAARDLPTVDFLGIGGMRTGSTWLHQCLNRHPQVWVPPMGFKELHYFNRLAEPGWPPPPSHHPLPGPRDLWADNWLPASHWRRGFIAPLGQLASRSARDRRLAVTRLALAFAMHRPGRKDDRWYRNLFRAGEGRVKGEITPNYAGLDDARIRHVATLFPDIRILFTIRDPIDRGISEIRLRLDDRHRRRKVLPLEGLIKTRHFQTQQGPVQVIDAWGKQVPPERFLLSWYDDLTTDPVAYLARVLSFLGVDATLAAGAVTGSTFINSSPRVEIPVEVVRAIAESSRPDLVKLAERFGGHAVRWLARCERILAGGPIDA